MEKTGRVVLKNAAPAVSYIEKKVNLLLNAKSHEEEKNHKLGILREFTEIYNYDCETAIRPEPFGTFADDAEKQQFIKLKQLIEDFGLYLGEIFYHYHKVMAQRNYRVPILKSSRLIIDYDELYLRAVNEYFGTLIGIKYPLRIGETTNHINSISKEKQYVEYRGQMIEIPPKQNAPDIEAPGLHAVGTTFILPVLIEHFLLMYLQNRMLKGAMTELKGKVDKGEVELNAEEQLDYSMFTSAIKVGSAVFDGTKEQSMFRVYQMFVKAGVLENNQDNQQILVGKTKRGISTLGTVLHSDYATREIRAEYYELLSILFGTKRLNIRNCIMHGNSVTYDYLAIGIAAVMLQLLWDIASEDVFVD
jgi:hypothetical protein